MPTKTLAWIHIGGGALCSAIAAPFIGIWLLQDPGGNKAQQSAGQTFFLLVAVYFGPSMIGGLGLLFRQRWGRFLLLAQSALYLFLFPIGTALGAFTLWVLLPRPAGPHPARTESTRPKQPQPLGRVAGILVAMAAVGAGFVVALAVLFRLHGEKAPPPIEQGFYGAILLLAVASVALVRSIILSRGAARTGWLGPDGSIFRKRRWARNARLLSEERRQQIKRLEADPATRKYAALMRNGQYWSDEEIAYDLDPTRLMTCAHLRPIELAMRNAGGLGVRIRGGPHIETACRIDADQLARQFAIAEPLFYTETFPGDRPGDPTSARLICREHGSSILVIHPEIERPETPWFPLPI